MNNEDILRKENFILEEERVLSYLQQNPDEAEGDEIEERIEEISKLWYELSKLKIETEKNE